MNSTVALNRVCNCKSKLVSVLDSTFLIITLLDVIIRAR